MRPLCSLAVHLRTPHLVGEAAPVQGQVPTGRLPEPDGAAYDVYRRDRHIVALSDGQNRL